ncbi:MAG: 50S ribosomal protein L20 [Nitrospirae bacterium]|nr:50S ribosomal protein L20 [Candidatus Manganitrophaceae bacterium]
MPRAKGGPKTRQRRKARLKMAKGYYGAKSKLFRTATEAVDKSLLYAYRDRRNRKRAFRRLWITRISAAAKLNGLNYSRLMDGLKKAGITLNRKILAEIAAHDPAGFTQIVEKMQARTEPASA